MKIHMKWYRYCKPIFHLFSAYSIPLYLHLQFISSYYKYWFENHLYGNVDIILAPKTLVIHDKLINGWKGKIRCKNMSKSCRQTVSFFFFFKHIIKSIQFSGGDKLWKDGWINLLSTPAIKYYNTLFPSIWLQWKLFYRIILSPLKLLSTTFKILFW